MIARICFIFPVIAMLGAAAASDTVYLEGNIFGACFWGFVAIVFLVLNIRVGKELFFKE